MVALVLLCACSGLSAAQAPVSAGSRAQPSVQPPAALSVEDAIARGMTANPTVVAARQRRAIDLASVNVARERPNPEARVEFERETPKRAYGLGVPVETAGKRAKRIAVGEAALRTGEAEVALTVLEVRAAIRRAYFARLVAESRMTLLDELLGLASRARDAARQRFEAGSAPRLELLQAELALAQTENEATAAGAAVNGARVQLNALLALPLDAATPLSSPIDAGVPPGLEDALNRARTANIEVAVLDRRIEEARARIELARALQMPDVMPEASITRGAEPEFDTGWRAAVGVTLPLFTRHRAGVLVEQATLSQLQAERDATLARVTGEVAAAAAVADAQRQQYARYRDQILPQAVEVERMAEDSYRLGQTGIAALLQALQATRDARLRALQAAADFQSALADLERAIGAPVP